MRLLPPCPPWVALPLMLLLLAANVLSGARQCLAYTDPVLPGQTVTGEYLGDWCDQWVYGTTNYTTITAGGVQWVYSGGVSNYTTMSGGAQWAKSGGVVNYTTLNGGQLGVEAGGVVNHATLNGGYIYVYSGGVSKYTVINGGIEYVYSGSTSNYATISGGTQDVSGTANYATLNSGTQNVYSGGLADNTTINGGVQNVQSGGSATNTTIAVGTQNVAFAGSATSTTINGGAQEVYGTADDTTINTGGAQNVYSGGTATNTTISGGIQNVLSGGTASGATIDSGTQNVAFGGSATSTTINGGAQEVHGAADDTTINTGGAQNVYSDGRATNTTISGGAQNVSGTADAATITSGAQNVQSGGTATNTTINGGAQYVLAGGTATGSVINSGGTMDLSGTAGSIAIHAGGALVVNHGGVISDSTLDNPGTLTFNANGGADAYALTITDSGGAGKTIVTGGGGVTLTGDVAQGLGVTIQGGGLTMRDNALAVSGAPTLTFDAGTSQATAVLDAVTLTMATGQDVFRVTGSSNSGNALTLKNMTVDATSPGSGVLLSARTGSVMNFTAVNSTLTGDIAFDATSSGSASLTAGSELTGIISGGPDLSIDANSKWIMTGDSSLGNLNVAGDLVFRNDGEPFTPKTLVVTGITGAQGLSGGTITLNTVLSNNHSLTDCIVVNGGEVTGTTKLYVNNVGGLGASTSGTNGIAVVLATNGASTAARLVDPGFYLANGPIYAGAYTYSLRPGDLYGQGQNWYLTTDFVPAMTFTPSSSGSSSGTSTATEYTGGQILITGDNPATVSLANVTVSSTFATGQAGALILASGASSTSNTALLDNVTATLGDGFLVSGTGGSNLTLTASGSTLTGNIAFDDTSQGMVNLVNGSALTGWIDPVSMFIDSTSKWIMTSDSILNNLTLAGDIYFETPTGSFTPKTLTVHSLTGQNGTITLNTYLGSDGSPSDKIVVDGGAVTGTTNLRINNVNGLGAQTVGNGILVVEAINGADTTAQSTRDGFTLSAPVYAGAYRYYLRAGDIQGQGQNWYLSSTASGLVAARTAYRPDDALFASAIGLSYDLMQTTLGALHVREGDDVNKASTGLGLTAWSRGLGGLLRKEGGGTVSPGYEGYTDGSQIGAELALESAGAIGVYGALAYGNAWSWGDSGGARFTNVGRLDMTAYSAGLYGTYRWAGKGYVNAVAQGSILKGHSYGTRNVDVNGYGWAASLEGGYPFRLGDSGFTLEPQAQAIYQRVYFDGVSLSETHAELQGGDRLTLRGGARLMYETTTANGVRWTPSLNLGIRRDQDSGAKVTMSTASASTDLSTHFSGTLMELGSGLTARIDDRLDLYGQAGLFTALDGKSSWGAQGSVGLRISF